MDKQTLIDIVVATISKLFIEGLESAREFVKAADALASALREAAQAENGMTTLLKGLNASPLARGDTKNIRLLINHGTRSIRSQMSRIKSKDPLEWTDRETNLYKAFGDNVLHFDGTSRKFGFRPKADKTPNKYKDIRENIPALSEVSDDDMIEVIINLIGNPSKDRESFDKAKAKAIELEAKLATTTATIIELTAKVAELTAKPKTKTKTKRA